MKAPTEIPDDISVDDLELWAAVVTVIGDILALFAVIKSRNEKESTPQPERTSKRRHG